MYSTRCSRFCSGTAARVEVGAAGEIERFVVDAIERAGCVPTN
jgi:hypothetical protein